MLIEVECGVWYRYHIMCDTVLGCSQSMVDTLAPQVESADPQSHAFSKASGPLHRPRVTDLADLATVTDHVTDTRCSVHAVLSQ